MTEEERSLIQANRFMRHCGIQLIQQEDGSCMVQAEVTPDFHNPYGIVHGGLLYTMADIVTGATARQFGRHPVTLESDFHFLRNVASGVLTARAEPVRVGRKIAVLRVQVANDEELLLADGTFTYYYVESEPIPK